MDIFEQFKLLVILLMALYSYHHINRVPALLPSEDQEEEEEH